MCRAQPSAESLGQEPVAAPGEWGGLGKRAQARGPGGQLQAEAPVLLLLCWGSHRTVPSLCRWQVNGLTSCPRVKEG